MGGLNVVDVPASGAPEALSSVARRLPGLIRCLGAAHAALLLHAPPRLAPAHWFGSSVLVLETVGRRTGRSRATPLVYLPHGRDVAVIPANAGADRPPAWWLNLETAGAGFVVIGSRRWSIAPRMATGAERRRLWQRFRAVTPVEHYQQRTRRTLPVVVLVRVARPVGLPPARKLT